jgi:hypothetical protein
VKKFTKNLCAVLLAGSIAAAGADRLMGADRVRSVGASGPESGYEGSVLRPPDPHKELHHLSKNLKLTRNQRAGVNSILEERAREIQLLLDVQALSEEYRNALAARVMEESNAQIEILLRSKQKRKFDKELAKDHETH